jgi:nitrogen regulatory protein P-II 1
MKWIEAIIRPNRLEAVKEALNQVEVVRLTVCDVQGFGRQRSRAEAYGGHDYTVTLHRKVKLEIAVNDDFVEPTIQAILRGGRNENSARGVLDGEDGRLGDGKIFVLPLEDCVRIRTGERGPEAI